VFFFAFLATGAYIAFDVLDLDGSDLRGRPAGGMAMAEPAGTAAEGRLRLDQAGPEPPAPAIAPPPPRFVAPPQLTDPRSAAMATVARRDRFPARDRFARSATRSDSLSPDPA
jgi:hypothetical protein